MFTTKMRAVAATALAAGAALAIAGAAQAGPLKPNAADPGDVQLLTTDGNSSLLHTIRHQNGSWQKFGRIDGYTGVVGLSSTLVNGEENVFFQYNGPKGAQLAHFIRHADGTWNWNAGTPALAAPVDNLAATTVNGEPVLAQYKDGAVQVSKLGSDGTWSPWAAVPTNGKVRSVAIVSKSNSLRVVGLSADGRTVTDYDQYPSGTWATVASAPVSADPAYTGTEVAAATDFNGVQVSVIEQYQNYYSAISHSILHDSTGAFDRFQPVGPVIGYWADVEHVAMTSWNGEMQLTFSTVDGRLLHTIRDYAGNWQHAGDVESVAGNATAGLVTIAGINYY